MAGHCGAPIQLIFKQAFEQLGLQYHAFKHVSRALSNASQHNMHCLLLPTFSFFLSAGLSGFQRHPQRRMESEC